MGRIVPILLFVGLMSGLWLPRATAARSTPAYVPGQILIQFREGTTAAQQQNARGRVNATRRETLRHQANGANGLELTDLPANANIHAAIAALQADPAIEFAEPNWVYTAGPVINAVPGDRGYTNGSLWGMYSDDKPTPVGPAGTTNPYGSQAEKAWAAGKTGSSGVYVGVLDEGIRFAHGDLNANIWTNPGESGLDANGVDKATNGLDDDGNGYADDVHGFDFYHNDGSVYDSGEDNHGTHVAGTIGARANNTDWDGSCYCGGDVGVNWNITLISAKFLGPNGGDLANAVKAVNYFTDLKKRGLNIVAINNSWGGGGYSQALYEAIVGAAKVNILFIVAAGNEGSNNDTLISYPSAFNTTADAGYDSVIAVAAIDMYGNRPSWSNYGRTTVDLGAPGADIWSTAANPAEWVNPYMKLSGTSMATPHVTGAAALYASVYPGATASQIRTALLGSTTKTSSLNGRVVTNGRLNINAALNLAPR